METKSANNLALILHAKIPADAPVDEQDVLNEVEALSLGLYTLGYRVKSLPLDLDLANASLSIVASQADIVINLVESLDGKGQLIGLVPALLESLQIKFSGAGYDAMTLTSNKLLAKHWMRSRQIDTPDWLESDGSVVPELTQAWIVKSVWEHASIGIDDASLVRDKQSLSARLQTMMIEHGGLWFAEQYIEGREFNIALLEHETGVEILPLAEMRFENYPQHKPHIVSFDAKWQTQSFAYQNTVRHFLDSKTEPLLAAQLERVAVQCWQAFGLSGYARVDVRVDAEGKVWVLEVNANPCLSADAGYQACLQYAGIGFEAAVARIIAAAEKRFMLRVAAASDTTGADLSSRKLKL